MRVSENCRNSNNNNSVNPLTSRRADGGNNSSTEGTQITLKGWHELVCSSFLARNFINMHLQANFPYHMGRVDCENSPDTEDMHDFPQAFFNHAEVCNFKKMKT